jgi:hypothetical protein
VCRHRRFNGAASLSTRKDAEKVVEQFVAYSGHRERSDRSIVNARIGAS